MAFEGSREKIGILAELVSIGTLFAFVLGLLVVFTQGSAVAPFIYTLF